MIYECTNPICLREGGCMFPQACPDDAKEKPESPSDAAACSAPAGETVKPLGFEWVRPDSTWWSGRDGQERIFAGAVAIQTNCGWLLLEKVEQVCDGPSAGQIRRSLATPEEIRVRSSQNGASDPPITPLKER